MNVQTDLSSSLAASSQSLDNLRTQAKQSPDQALKAAAKQFETVFMGMMLKSMRDATPQDGMMDSEQTKMFTGMLDQQLAQNITNKGVGLADIIARQLSKTLSPDSTVASKSTLPTDVTAVSSNKLHSKSPLFTPAQNSPGSGANAPALRNNTATAVPSAYSENFQQGFVQRMTPYAQQASQKTGVSAPLMMGQAALESGWGRHEIRMPDGSSSYNLFGIKAGAGWNGKVAEVTTTEYKNGVPHKQVEKFRAYGSYAEAFNDYANVLSTNPRYAAVMQAGQGTHAVAQAVQHAGYATDPHYASKLASVMHRISTIAA